MPKVSNFLHLCWLYNEVVRYIDVEDRLRGIDVEDRLRGVNLEDLQKLPDALLKSFNRDELKRLLKLLNDKIAGDE